MAFLCCASWRDHCFGFCIGWCDPAFPPAVAARRGSGSSASQRRPVVFSSADVSSCSPSSGASEASTTWPLQQGVCRISSEVMEPLLADVPREFNRIFTDGDGACSLHSLFGRPRRDLGRTRIFCENAYARGAATLEAFFSDNVHREAWAILRECVQNNVWKELVWPAVLRGSERTAQPFLRNVRIFLQLLQEEEGLWQQLGGRSSEGEAWLCIKFDGPRIKSASTCH